jgi:hypothetical protein
VDGLFSAPDYWWARLIFERALAITYLIAFLVAYNQFPVLLGENGLMPVPKFLRNVNFKMAPSLFHWKYSDLLLRVVASVGIGLSLLIALGFFSLAPALIHMSVWLLLYGLYLSIVNVGQTFYGFGWESMLLEAGFFMSFFGPEWMAPSWIPLIALRWMLFRTELGAGLIKIRGDECWKNLTCLYYHHETQPLPNRLSCYFHFAPKIVHRSGVLFSHFVQLIVPFGLFLPQPFAQWSGLLIIGHQLILVISGNYSWLNWLTIILAVLCFAHPFTGALMMTPTWMKIFLYGQALLIVVLSIPPAFNLFSPRQKMNYCWNRFHLVCAYGAFGSVTKKRYEVIIEGTSDEVIDQHTVWQEYEFKAKPGNVKRIPPLVAPYHFRLDWMMWFLPFSVILKPSGIQEIEYESWFLNLIYKFLVGDNSTLKLIKFNPFHARVPKYIRASYYLYEFNSVVRNQVHSNFWKRQFIDQYLPPLSLENFRRNI